MTSVSDCNGTMQDKNESNSAVLIWLKKNTHYEVIKKVITSNENIHMMSNSLFADTVLYYYRNTSG
jgi:hypothetical protein